MAAKSWPGMTGPRNNIQKGTQQKMFLVTDRTRTTPHTTKLNDIKDIKYVVTQITFDESIGNAAEIIAANMRFGDRFNYSKFAVSQTMKLQKLSPKTLSSPPTKS